MVSNLSPSKKKGNFTMNNIRRKKLEKALSMIGSAKDILDEVRDEEQEAFDNLPESFQYSERGEQMKQYIDSLEEAYSTSEDSEYVISEI